MAIFGGVCQQKKRKASRCLSLLLLTDIQCISMNPNQSITCCPPLLEGRLTSDDANYLAAIFRVLGEPARGASQLGTE